MTDTTAAQHTNGDQPTDPIVSRIHVDRLARLWYEIPIVGTAPLIVHSWGKKADILAAQHEQATSSRRKKAAKVAEDEAEDATYRLTDGSDGFPASAFKAAIVSAARLFGRDVKMSELKTFVSVTGDGLSSNGEQLLRLDYDEKIVRRDTPRNANGQPDVRYRPQYNGWRCTLRVSIPEQQMSDESLLALVDAAGIGGVGEWRPNAPKSHTGSYGTFEVDVSKFESDG